VIPLHDRNPTTRRAYVTLLLIVACTVVYFAVQERPGRYDIVRVGGQNVQIDASVRFTLEYAAVPCEITHGRPLTIEEIDATFNGDQAKACESHPTSPELFAHKNVWLAVLTSIFLHGSILHLAGNMLFLWVFGNNIEDHLGHGMYLAFYLAGGLVAAIAHIAVQPDSTLPVVGASGAIAAVMGAYLVWFPRARVTSLIILIVIPIVAAVPAMWLLSLWFVSQFFTAPDSSVAWVAHVAGFIFGALVALAVRRNDMARAAVWRGRPARS
jgi:membrane associated rhomboid family serine protease